MSTVGPWRPESLDRSSATARPPNPRRSQRTKSGTPLENPLVRKRLIRRVRIAEGLVIVMVTLLLFGFWRLQVVHASRYIELAENNRYRNLVVRAPRGLITDRRGEPIAANRAAFNVAIVLEEVKDRDATLGWLAGVLGITPEALVERLQQRPAALPIFQPVVIANDIDRSLVAAIEARSRDFPGVIVQPQHKRHYPKGLVAAHVLGQVGEISREQLDAWEPDRYRPGDIVGRDGIELVYNDALAGRAGDQRVLVNSAGRTVRVASQASPLPGNTLTLTLDLAMQQQAEALLAGKKGAIVALDIDTGAVLALASAPAYDPNMFARRSSADEWEALRNDATRPLQNRAVHSSFPPGSVFKLIVAALALERGVITPETAVNCAGGREYHGQYRRCNAVHGVVNLEHAIGGSCNVYFYEIGARLGRAPIIEAAQRYGLGGATGIDLLGESSGILPTDEWIAQRPGADNGNWWPGETIGLSIGQGPIDTTPLQLAHVAATIASGRSVKPRLIARAEDSAGRNVPMQGTAAKDVGLQPHHREAILRGMSAAVNQQGSARLARSTIVEIGGKTGTAQVASFEAAGPEDARPEHLRSHAWFVGVAPVNDPQIAVAVFVENGGGGGLAAAPIGGELLQAFFSRPAEEQR